jgi:GNAT superfamily N-acetyltransferase
MTNPTSIRRAFPSEIDEIMRHRRGMFHDMGFTHPSALDAMQCTSEGFIKEALTDGSYHQWFAEISGSQVIGGVAVLTHPWVSSPVNPRPQKAYVLNMYVYPEFRGKGVAQGLMRRAIQWCREEGFRSAYLHASEMGKPLYERLGFRPTNEMRLELT